MKVLIDTNVIIDFLASRNPFFDDSNMIIQLCSVNKVHGFVAAHTIMNVFYILRKEYDLETRRIMLSKLMTMVDVVEIGADKILSAIRRNDFKDMEDCLQDECALSCGADFIITRNIKDFDKSKTKDITPNDFLMMIGNI